MKITFNENQKRKTRSFLFKKDRSNNSKSIIFQLFFASFLFVICFLLSSFLINNLESLNLEQFFIEFIIHSKLTFSSLYLMLFNLFSIILILLLFILAAFLNLASLFRIVKLIRYFINKKKPYRSTIARKVRNI